MKTRRLLGIYAIALALGAVVAPAQTGAQAILGKWLVKADTPQGLMDLEFEFKQEGEQLTGTGLVMGSSVTLSNVQFDGSKVTADLGLGGETYRLAASLSGGKLSGTWEQSGGDMKGTWSAERAVGAPAGTVVGSVIGAWDTVAVTPGGDLRAVLDVKQDAANLTGSLSSEMGTVPVSAVTFKDGKFHFEIDLGGTVYAVNADLQGNALKGKWSPVAGGEGGDWSATRKGTEPAAAAAPVQESLAGTWDATAESPDGNLSFQMRLEQTGESVSGQLVTPDGAISIQKPAYAAGRLSFEVGYMGGTYRIELVLEGAKLTGKWTEVGGTDSGRVNAQKKTP